MPTALAVSPHLDDAAFSAGGTLATLADRGWRVVVATVFTATIAEPQGFALACQLDKGLGPEVDYMALRRAEDRVACTALGAETVHLAFAEAPHRGYESAPALFGPARADDEVDVAVADALDRLLEDLRPDLLLAPQSVGAHVDHRAVTHAVFGQSPRPPTAWWRDHPYAARPVKAAEPFAARFAELSLLPVASTRAAFEAKRQACRAYASQLGFQFGGAAALDALLADTRGTEAFRIDPRAAQHIQASRAVG